VLIKSQFYWLFYFENEGEFMIVVIYKRSRSPSNE